MFLYSKWLSLSLPMRVQIAGIFKIAKRGPTHVDSNRIVSDGYDIKEIEASLNIDALQKYLETTSTDMQVLWDMLIAKMEGREYKFAVIPEIEPIDTNFTYSKPLPGKIKVDKIALPKKKRGRPAKKK